MAKITVEFDTGDKTLSVLMDGTAVANVEEVYVSRRYSDKGYSCHFTTVREDKDNGYMEMTRVMAAESAEGQQARHQAVPVKDHPEFIMVPAKTKAQSDIEKFFQP